MKGMLRLTWLDMPVFLQARSALEESHCREAPGRSSRPGAHHPIQAGETTTTTLETMEALPEFRQPDAQLVQPSQPLPAMGARGTLVAHLPVLDPRKHLAEASGPFPGTHLRVQLHLDGRSNLAEAPPRIFPPEAPRSARPGRAG